MADQAQFLTATTPFDTGRVIGSSRATSRLEPTLTQARSHVHIHAEPFSLGDNLSNFMFRLKSHSQPQAAAASAATSTSSTGASRSPTGRSSSSSSSSSSRRAVIDLSTVSPSSRNLAALDTSAPHSSIHKTGSTRPHRAKVSSASRRLTRPSRTVRRNMCVTPSRRKCMDSPPCEDDCDYYPRERSHHHIRSRKGSASEREAPYLEASPSSCSHSGYSSASGRSPKRVCYGPPIDMSPYRLQRSHLKRILMRISAHLCDRIVADRRRDLRSASGLSFAFPTASSASPKSSGVGVGVTSSLGRFECFDDPRVLYGGVGVRESVDASLPNWVDVNNYLRVLYDMVESAQECAVQTLILLDRFLAAAGADLRLRTSNWRGVLLTAFLVVHKVHEDESFSNEQIVHYFKHCTNTQLNAMEVAFLDALGFDAFVNTNTYNYYVERIVTGEALPTSAVTPTRSGEVRAPAPPMSVLAELTGARHVEIAPRNSLPFVTYPRKQRRLSAASPRSSATSNGGGSFSASLAYVEQPRVFQAPVARTAFTLAASPAESLSRHSSLSDAASEVSSSAGTSRSVSPVSYAFYTHSPRSSPLSTISEASDTSYESSRCSSVSFSSASPSPPVQQYQPAPTCYARAPRTCAPAAEYEHNFGGLEQTRERRVGVASSTPMYAAQPASASTATPMYPLSFPQAMYQPPAAPKVAPMYPNMMQQQYQAALIYAHPHLAAQPLMFAPVQIDFRRVVHA